MSFVSHWLFCCVFAQSNSNMKLVDNEGLSLLHYACLGQHIGCVQLLLNNAASVLLKDKVVLSAISLVFLRVISHFQVYFVI